MKKIKICAVLSFIIFTMILSSCIKVEEVGTAMINGKQYKQTESSNILCRFPASPIVIWSDDHILSFETFLMPVEDGGSKYSISFYLLMKDDKIDKGNPYKIEYNDKLNGKGLLDMEIRKRLSSDKTLFLSEGGDGIAFAIENDAVNQEISLEGEFIIANVDLKKNKCSGKYYLRTPAGSLTPLIIEGTFNTEIEN